ncbi:hypothetical protein LCGC14_0957520 [marine sediment metagenome]|uniref:Uncharacterized protein n=1 Tax=marine sediment metagenome TaxID=412755 RepID=A0A0F9RLZ4_9ZZZZ
MITGLNKAWLKVLVGTFHEQASALDTRGYHWGILVKDDIQACRYQYAKYRYYRALQSLQGHGICIQALSFSKSGWIDKTKEHNDNYMQTVRERAIKAKQILEKYYKEESEKDIYNV